MTRSPPPIGRRLLALVGLHDTPVPRGYVCQILWPEVAVDAAASRLQSTLYRLRRQLPDVVTLSSDGALGIHPDTSVDVRALAATAFRALDGDDEVVGPLAATAGALLPDWEDDWVLLHRERLRILRLQALEVACERLTSSDLNDAAVIAGRAAVASAPLRESARRALMRAYLASGRMSDAATEYERYRCLLHAELELRPSAAMEGLATACGLARDQIVTGG